MENKKRNHWSNIRAYELAEAAFSQLKNGEYERSQSLFHSLALKVTQQAEICLNDLQFTANSRICAFEPEGKEEEGLNDAFLFHYVLLELLAESLKTIHSDFLSRYQYKPHVSKENRKRLSGIVDQFVAVLETIDDRPEAPPKKKRRKAESLSTNDPMGLIPEIVSQILGYLGTKDLVTATRVSHSWNRSVNVLSTLLTEPRFADNVGVLGVTNYAKICERNGIKRVHEITFPGISYRQSESNLQVLAKGNIQVDSMFVNYNESLDLKPIKPLLLGVRALRVMCNESYALKIRRLIKLCPQLRTFYIKFGKSFPVKTDLTLTNIDSLEIDSPHQWTASSSATFFKECRFSHIEKLALCGMPLDAQTFRSIVLKVHPASLKLDVRELNWVEALQICYDSGLHLKCLHLCNLSFPDDTVQIRGLSNLESFTLSYTLPHDISWQIVLSLLDGTNGQLKNLRFEMAESKQGSFPFAGVSFADIFKRCPLLESLSIAFNGKLDIYNELGSALNSEHLPNFKSLRLEAKKVSDMNVRSMFKQEYRPKFVDLVISKRIGWSVVRYLRSKGYCSRVRNVR